MRVLQSIYASSVLSLFLVLSACQQSKDKTEDKSSDSTSTAETALSPDIKKIQTIAHETTHGYMLTRELTTEIGQRLAGSESEAAAREWMVKKFTKLGFENVRIEPFTVPGWQRGEERAEITAPFPQNLVITALGNSVATPDEGLEADVVYFPTFDDLEDSAFDTLNGKIAFISGKMEKAHDGAGYGPANRKRRSGASEAAKRGAVGVLIRSVGTDSHRFPHTGMMRYEDGVKQVPIAALSSPDADQLERLFQTGNNVRIKMTLTPKHVGDLPSGNVVGEIVGSEKPDEIILIGGHLDSWDLGTGAIDDAAGVGITAGAAKVLLEAGLKPKRTIRVVAFGSEEIGLLGGYAYAKEHKDDLANHVFASESDFGAGPVYGLRTSAAGAARETVKSFVPSLSGLGVKWEDGPTSGGPDITPIFEAGVPAIRLQQNGIDYFDLHHTPDDTFDKIVPAEMSQNIAAWATMLWLISESDTDFRSKD